MKQMLLFFLILTTVSCVSKKAIIDSETDSIINAYFSGRKEEPNINNTIFYEKMDIETFQKYLFEIPISNHNVEDLKSLKKSIDSVKTAIPDSKNSIDKLKDDFDGEYHHFLTAQDISLMFEQYDILKGGKWIGKNKFANWLSKDGYVFLSRPLFNLKREKGMFFSKSTSGFSAHFFQLADGDWRYMFSRNIYIN